MLMSRQELDQSMKRGFPQHLHPPRLDEIRKTWLTHAVPSFVARKMEALLFVPPSFFLPFPSSLLLPLFFLPLLLTLGPYFIRVRLPDLCSAIRFGFSQGRRGLDEFLTFGFSSEERLRQEGWEERGVYAQRMSMDNV